MNLNYTPDVVIIEKVGDIERTEVWRHFSQYVESQSFEDKIRQEDRRRHQDLMRRVFTEQN